MFNTREARMETGKQEQQLDIRVSQNDRVVTIFQLLNDTFAIIFFL